VTTTVEGEDPRSAADRSPAPGGSQPLRVVGAGALGAWAVLAAAGGGMDLGNATGGSGPLGAFLGLVVAAPLAAAAAWFARRRFALGGPAALALWSGAGLAVLAWLSIAWAVEPSLAWVAGNRAALLAAVGALLPSSPRRYPIALSAAAAVPVGLALLTKALPEVLGSDGAGARLSSPVDYANALALVAAVAVPGAVMAAGGAGRWRTPLAAAWLACLFTAAMLTLSRSGIVATALALCLVLALTPGARAGAAAAAAGLVGAVAPVAYALRSAQLSTDGLDAAERAGAGAVFGGLLVGGAVLAAVLAGPAARLASAARIPRARHVLAGLAVVLALTPAVVVAADAGAISSCGGGAVDNTPGRLTDSSANQRGAWWCQAASGWAAQPLRGNGAGSFPVVQRRERENGDDRVLTRDPHQVFLAPASDLGALGLALTLGLWAAVGWAVLRLRRRVPAGLAAILAAAGVQSLTDWTLTWPAAGLPVLAALGILAATAARGLPARRLGAGAEGTLAAALAVVAVAAPLSAMMPWWSDHASRASAEARVAGDLDRALRLAADARSRNPLSLQPLEARALALLAAGDRAGAEDALRERTRVQPENPDAWRRLALFLGDRPGARFAWIRVHVLDPQAADARRALLIPDDGPPGIA